MTSNSDDGRGQVSASGSMSVAASCADVYSLITDLASMATLAAETDGLHWVHGEGAVVGAVFEGHNTNGDKAWTTRCTVTHAEPGRVFAFDVLDDSIPISHWRYDIEPLGDGCRVTEQTWDQRPTWFLQPAAEATGVADRKSENVKNIQLTLQHVKAKAETGG